MTNILTFLGQKAAAGPLGPVPGPLGSGPKPPLAQPAPAGKAPMGGGMGLPPTPSNPNLPPGGAPRKIPGSNNPAQRLDEFLWLTGMSPNRPGHLGQPPAAAPTTPQPASATSPAPAAGSPGSWGSSMYGLGEMVGAVPSTNPLGMGAMFGPSAALGWGLPWLAKKVAPGATGQLASRLGGTAAGKFLNSSGAAGNAFNLARSMSPWAAGGAAPANAFAPGAALAAPGGGGAAGVAGTAAGALYGAYALGDVPIAGYQLATGQWNPRERTNEQAARMQGNGVLGNTGGYFHNVGENLVRPGKALINHFSDQLGIANDLGTFARRSLTGSRF